MHVRNATQTDMPEVQDLLRRTWHSTYDGIYGVETVDEISADWHSITSLTSALENPAGLFLIYPKNFIVGMAYATLDERTIMLHQLYVDPDVQGEGIGTALHQAVISSFANAERLSLEVEPQNIAAIRFYAKLGYVEVNKTDHCGQPDSGISALIMEKCLS